MQKQRIAGLAAGAGLLVGGYVYASPYITLHNLRNAIENNDAAAIERQVDFPALRESLKEQAKAAMLQSMQREMAGNPFAALGMALAGPMVDSMVDVAVTPTGLRQLLASGRLAAQPGDPATTEPAAQPATSPLSNVSLGYVSINRFEVRIPPEQGSGAATRLILARSGLSDWKVTAIALPI